MAMPEVAMMMKARDQDYHRDHREILWMTMMGS
jgi:hypothetical protein